MECTERRFIQIAEEIGLIDPAVASGQLSVAPSIQPPPEFVGVPSVGIVEDVHIDGGNGLAGHRNAIVGAGFDVVGDRSRQASPKPSGWHP
jgi:hypothetical protein